MNEVNVTVNGVGTREEKFVARNDETKSEKFIRLGEYCMNKAIDVIGGVVGMISLVYLSPHLIDVLL